MTAMTSLKRLGRRIYRRCDEARCYVSDAVGTLHSDQVRLLIIGQGRTGSTLLEDLLCSTGYFERKGELVHTYTGDIIGPVSYLRGVAKQTAPKNLVVHVKIYQLTRERKRPVDPRAFLSRIYRDGWKVIYLRRRNKFKHALSNVVAEYRGDYYKRDDTRETFQLSVDTHDLLARIHERSRMEQVERQALENVEYHEVVYEDDLEKSVRHQPTIDRVLSYLSLEHREVSTTYRKVNARPVADSISNYEEVVDCLRVHQLREFLD